MCPAGQVLNAISRVRAVRLIEYMKKSHRLVRRAASSSKKEERSILSLWVRERLRTASILLGELCGRHALLVSYFLRFSADLPI